MVHRREDQRGAPVRRRLGRPNPRGRRGRLGGRGRRGPSRHLSGAPRADRPAGARTAIARRGAAGRRGHLHADGDRDGGRAHGLLQAGRDLGPDLQRVRSRGGRGSPGRCRGEGPDHGGRIAPPRTPRADEGDRRPRRGRGGRRRSPAGLGQTRGRGHAVERAAGRPVGGAPRGATRPLRHRAARQRAPALHRLHQRDDGHAEGRAARPRRVPGEDRGGGRVPGRCASGRRAALGDGPRVDHGAVGDRRRARAGRDGGAHRGSAELPRPRSAVGDGGAPRRHHPGRLADADPRADPQRHRTRSRARPLILADPGVDRRAVEPRALPMVDGGGRRGQVSRSSTCRAAPRSARASCRRCRSRS